MTDFESLRSEDVFVADALSDVALHVRMTSTVDLLRAKGFELGR